MPAVVVNVSSHQDDYGKLIPSGSAPAWRWFAAPDGGRFAVTHPERAAECVSELHTKGADLYLASHYRESGYPGQEGLIAAAKHYVEYQHFNKVSEQGRAFWQAGLFPIVHDLIENPSEIKSAAKWQRLLEVLSDPPGTAVAAAEQLLDLLQETLWALEQAASHRQNIILMATESQDELDEELDRALKLLNYGDRVVVTKKLSAAAWTALRELAKVNLPADAETVAALAAIEALSKHLFGDELSAGILDDSMRGGGV